MDSVAHAPITKTEQTNLRRQVARFRGPVLWKSLFQLATSFGGFFVTCAAMYVVIDVSTWMALALAPLAAGFLVRIFIIQHDAGHSSFFRSRGANDVVGFVCSLLTLTPLSLILMERRSRSERDTTTVVIIPPPTIEQRNTILVH